MTVRIKDKETDRYKVWAKRGNRIDHVSELLTLYSHPHVAIPSCPKQYLTNSPKLQLSRFDIRAFRIPTLYAILFWGVLRLAAYWYATYVVEFKSSEISFLGRVYPRRQQGNGQRDGA